MKHLLILLILFTTFGNFAQQTDIVDFLRIEAKINPNSLEKKITGSLRCTFRILKATDSVFLDAIDIKILESALKGVTVTASEKRIWLTDSFIEGREYTAFFLYEAQPKQTLYFTGNQIWTQGQGKYTSHWLPSIDDMNDKIEFDLQIIAPPMNTVIANGKREEFMILDEKKIAWQFNMDRPMSSYLAALVIGDFDKIEITSSSGVPIELYYKPKDSNKVEPTYRYTKEIFDFLETEIGVPYPWQNYKQVPVRDFLYAGMENTTLTIFSEAFVVDSTGFNDRNYINVNAHEMAHQWFGNLVTETSGTHHWLQEGFATYYAYLAEKELFGNDYYYRTLYNSAEQLKALSEEGKGESLLNPKASSLTFYEKGAWALHILRELIGDTAFRLAVKNYLTKYQYKNVNTENFTAEVNAVSDVNIAQWEEDWLLQSAFKAEQAFNSLMKSDYIKAYLNALAVGQLELKDKREEIVGMLNYDDDFIGQLAIYQLGNEALSEAIPYYKIGFETGNLYTRQAIAFTLQTIPKELQKEYESLLDDDSYVTKELALYQLWSTFQDHRVRYLTATKGIEGFQDRNLRLLWLALAFLTDGYEVSAKPIFKKELQGYTSNRYSFEIRQKAFEYVNELDWYDKDVIENLVNAAVHHNWRFRNFSRKLLSEVLKNPMAKEIIMNELDSYPEKERDYLKTKLEIE